MSGTCISAALTVAYFETDYMVLEPHRFTLKIGAQCLDILRVFEEQGCSNAAFLTAWNPYSELKSDRENKAAQQRLENGLDRNSYVLFQGIGNDPSGKWPGEPSVLVLGISREEASRFGSEFRQNAFVWIGSDGIPELVTRK
jgi:hypothetical protein